MPWGDHTKGPWGGRPPSAGQQPPDFESVLRKGREYLNHFFSGNGNRPPLTVLAGVIAVLWLAIGFYVVGPEEQAVVLRFGAFQRVADPGLNYHIPAPVERVQKVSVTTINRVEVGVRTMGASVKGGKLQKVAEESLMLTGDENVVDVDFEVQWKVNDASKFLFEVRDSAGTVKSVAESAMREVVGRTPIADVLTEGRAAIEQETRQIIQTMLDTYRTGIEVVRLQMREVQPPAAVIDAFRDVQTARADRERARNEAETYRNDIIPRARGEAEKVIQEAEAYKQKMIAKAKGEADRFLAVYGKYKDARDVTRRRIYLETMEEILRDINKVLIDDQAKGAGVIPYMPLPELKGKAVN